MPDHRVYFHFFVRGADNATGQQWVLNFLEEYLRTPIGLIRTCKNEEAVRKIAKNGRGLETDDLEKDFVRDLKVGRGSVWLQLTEAQYEKLKRTR